MLSKHRGGGGVGGGIVLHEWGYFYVLASYKDILISDNECFGLTNIPIYIIFCCHAHQQQSR